MKVEPRAFSLLHTYQENRTRLQVAMQRVASGSRIKPIGSSPAAYTAMSDRFDGHYSAAYASKSNINSASHFNYTAYTVSEQIFSIAKTMKARAVYAMNYVDNMGWNNVRTEFDLLKDQIQHAAHSLYYDKQLTGRDVIASFDSNIGINKLRFWDSNGQAPSEIDRDLANTYATDKEGDFIGFDSSRSFTMGNSGENLFFIGDDGESTPTYTLKRYNIDGEFVTSGDSCQEGDTLYVTELGTIYTNSNTNLKTINEETLDKSSTVVGGINDMLAGSSFSAYNNFLPGTQTSIDIISYVNSSNEIVRTAADGTVITAAIDVRDNGSGGDINYGGTTVTDTFADGVIHAFSHTGTYAADYITVGGNDTIRIVNTSTNTGALISMDNVSEMGFNQDGDRLYYIDSGSNSIKYISLSTDPDTDQISYVPGETVIQGNNSSSLQGLSLGGANPGSVYKFSMFDGSYTEQSYSAIDLSLRGLGLIDANLNSVADAVVATKLMNTAADRILAAMAKASAAYEKFSLLTQGTRNYMDNIAQANANITRIDVPSELAKVAELSIKNEATVSLLSKYNTIYTNNILKLLQ